MADGAAELVQEGGQYAEKVYTEVEWARWLAAKLAYALRTAQRRLPANSLASTFQKGDAVLQELGRVCNPSADQPRQTNVQNAPHNTQCVMELLGRLGQRPTSVQVATATIELGKTPVRAEDSKNVTKLRVQLNVKPWKSWIPAIVRVQRWWRQRSYQQSDRTAPREIHPETTKYIKATADRWAEMRAAQHYRSGYQLAVHRRRMHSVQLERLRKKPHRK